MKKSAARYNESRPQQREGRRNESGFGFAFDVVFEIELLAVEHGVGESWIQRRAVRRGALRESMRS